MDKERTNNTPPLRFKGFEEEVVNCTEAQEIFEQISEKGYPELPVLSASQEEGMIERGDSNRNITYKKESLVGYKKISPKQFAIHLRSFQGGFAHSNREGITSPAYTILGFKQQIHDDRYWKQLLMSKRFIWDLRKVTYGIRDGRSISVEEFFKSKLSFPSLPEQEKIGAFFKELDELIGAKEEELEKLRQMKAALLEAMFPSDDVDSEIGGGKSLILSDLSDSLCVSTLPNTPRLRFRGFTEPWEKKKLGEVAEVVREKNISNTSTTILTNSAEHGIISQSEFFDHQVASKENLSTYLLVRENDFVYNPRISVTAPVGPINRLQNIPIGVVSPIYMVFRTCGVSLLYLDYYFKTRLWHSFIQINGNTGARGDRYSITDCVLMEIPIPFPSLPEQEKIGAFFREQDEGIAAVVEQIDKLKTMKQACLAQMFA